MPRASVDDRPWPKPGWGWVTCPVCGDKITNNARGRQSHVKACYKKNQLKLLAKRLYEAAKKLSDDSLNGVVTASERWYGSLEKLNTVLAEYEEATK